MPVLDKPYANWNARQKNFQYWKITDTGTGNVIVCDAESIGAVVFNAGQDSATVFLDFVIPGSGNNQAPAVLDVVGQDAVDLATFLNDAWVIEFNGQAPP